MSRTWKRQSILENAAYWYANPRGIRELKSMRGLCKGCNPPPDSSGLAEFRLRFPTSFISLHSINRADGSPRNGYIDIYDDGRGLELELDRFYSGDLFLIIECHHKYPNPAKPCQGHYRSRGLLRVMKLDTATVGFVEVSPNFWEWVIPAASTSIEDGGVIDE